MGRSAARPTETLSKRSQRRRNLKTVHSLIAKYKNLDRHSRCNQTESFHLVDDQVINNASPSKQTTRSKRVQSSCNVIFNEDWEEDNFNCDYSDHLSETDSTDPILNLLTSIKIWGVRNKIKREPFNEILKILKQHECFNQFPIDSRTLYDRVFVNYNKIGSGEFVHFGLEKYIASFYKESSVVPDIIRVQINIDGLPEYKNTNGQFWPILGSFYGTKYVFVIALFYGTSMPQSLEEYLAEFIIEANK